MRILVIATLVVYSASLALSQNRRDENLCNLRQPPLSIMPTE